MAAGQFVNVPLGEKFPIAVKNFDFFYAICF